VNAAAPLLDSDARPATAAGWAQWLSAQEEVSKALYKTKPKLLIADYRREMEFSRDYEGREILELLQNASDAASDAGELGRVLISLTPASLVVANTGAPFTVGGVESLQTSNLSPKRRSQRPVIGSKGLGFRAVLNWSRSPIILSGGLGLAFDRDYAQQKLEELLRDNPELGALIQREKLVPDELVVPALVFPGFNQKGDLMSLLKGKPSEAVLMSCAKLRSEGFATVIAMPFDRPRAFAHAKAQLAGLHPELLLFVRSLSEISISEDGKPPKVWKREGSSNPVRVFVNGIPHHEWNTYTETGKIPVEHLEDTSTQLEYEIIVAIPKRPMDKPVRLFSHFPTDINLPLSVVCRATLDLQQNRQHAHDNPANRFVLLRLAGFLAQVVEDYGAAHPDNPWAACDLLLRRGDFGSDLERVNFYDQLLGSSKSRAIIPTLDGSKRSVQHF